MRIKQSLTAWRNALPVSVVLLTIAGCHRNGNSTHAPPKPPVPLLLYSWWNRGDLAAMAARTASPHLRISKGDKNDWFSPGAIGFLSPSLAVFALSSGPVLASRPQGSKLFRLDDAWQSQKFLSILQSHPREPFWPDAANLRTPTVSISQLPTPQSWSNPVFGVCGATSPETHLVATSTRLGNKNFVALWSGNARSNPIQLRTDWNNPATALSFSTSGKELAVGYDSLTTPGPVCVIWRTDSATPAPIARYFSRRFRVPAGLAYISAHRVAVEGGAQIFIFSGHRRRPRKQIGATNHMPFTGSLLKTPGGNDFLAATGTIGVVPGISAFSDQNGALVRHISIHFEYADQWYIVQLANSGNPKCVIAALTSNIAGGIGFFVRWIPATGEWSGDPPTSSAAAHRSRYRPMAGPRSPAARWVRNFGDCLRPRRGGRIVKFLLADSSFGNWHGDFERQFKASRFQRLSRRCGHIYNATQY